MQAWLESLVKDLVSKPEAVSITHSQGFKTSVFDIKLASEDLPQFRNQQQRLLKALTTVAGLAGAASRIRYVLKVSA